MININIDKVKLIAHDMRRKARAIEFAPHDEVISKQIPGNDLVAAEAARAVIRARYATMQTNIDSSVTVDDIKSALGI